MTIPVASATNASIRPNQTVAASTLFNASDADGDPVTIYRFWDGGIAGGHFTVNGATQNPQQNIDVSAANLSSVNFVGGSTSGTEVEWIQVFAGGEWSSWVSWNIATVNNAPVAIASNRSVTFNTALAASTLFSASDQDGDAITQYRFWDSGAGG